LRRQFGQRHAVSDCLNWIFVAGSFDFGKRIELQNPMLVVYRIFLALPPSYNVYNPFAITSLPTDRAAQGNQCNVPISHNVLFVHLFFCSSFPSSYVHWVARLQRKKETFCTLSFLVPPFLHFPNDLRQPRACPRTRALILVPDYTYHDTLII